MLGRYTGEANGVTRIMRAELPNSNDINQAAGLELRSFRVWWAANHERFEPAAKEELERLKAAAEAPEK